jgi:hypothetical protein
MLFTIHTYDQPWTLILKAEKRKMSSFGPFGSRKKKRRSCLFQATTQVYDLRYIIIAKLTGLKRDVRALPIHYIVASCTGVIVHNSSCRKIHLGKPQYYSTVLLSSLQVSCKCPVYITDGSWWIPDLYQDPPTGTLQ